MHVEDRHGVDELRRSARSQKDGRMRVRLQALVLAKQGRTAEEIAAALDASRRPVQEWVRRYNQWGMEGLRRRPGQGRREKLSLEERDRLCARMEALPREEDEVCTLRGKDIQRILQKEFGKLYHLNGVYALLHRLGYSCLMPRPRHQKADSHAQEAFKKTSWHRSRPSARIIPGSTWKSGSRTKRVSDNKAR
jgi:transposase